jgi:hypothetical protein
MLLLIDKYALATEKGEVFFNLTLSEYRSKKLKKLFTNKWVVATQQEHNPPDKNTYKLLIRYIAKKLKKHESKIGINSSGEQARWVVI